MPWRIPIKLHVPVDKQLSSQKLWYQVSHLEEEYHLIEDLGFHKTKHRMTTEKVGNIQMEL